MGKSAMLNEPSDFVVRGDFEVGGDGARLDSCALYDRAAGVGDGAVHSAQCLLSKCCGGCGQNSNYEEKRESGRKHDRAKPRNRCHGILE